MQHWYKLLLHVMIVTDVVNSFHTELGNTRMIQLLFSINNTIRHKQLTRYE